MPVAQSQKVKLTIYGNLASKSNTRQLKWHKGPDGKPKPVYIKSKRALKFEKQAALQITGKHRVGLDGPLCLTARVFYDSRRPDLDVSLLMDVLEKTGVYKNDRQIVEQHLYKRLDPHNPRVEVVVGPSEEA